MENNVVFSELYADEEHILFLYIYFILNILLFYYSCPNFTPLALLHPSQPLLPQPIPPPCCLHPWVIHSCSLTSAFPFFQPLSPSLLPFGHCQSVPCFQASGSILLVCFIHQVSLTGEIIWCSSFTAWLISLSIMLSSCIHAVTKGRTFFFLSAAQYSIV